MLWAILVAAARLTTIRSVRVITDAVRPRRTVTILKAGITHLSSTAHGTIEKPRPANVVGTETSQLNIAARPIHGRFEIKAVAKTDGVSKFVRRHTLNIRKPSCATRRPFEKLVVEVDLCGADSVSVSVGDGNARRLLTPFPGPVLIEVHRDLPSCRPIER